MNLLKVAVFINLDGPSDAAIERNLPTRVENVCPYVPAAHILYERNEELMDMHRERESVVVWPSFCETVQKDTCLPPSLAHMSRHSRDFAGGKREGVGSRGQSAKGSIVAPQSVRHCLVIGVCKVRWSPSLDPPSSPSFSKSADVWMKLSSHAVENFST